jgi:putative N6-adenine-specific DNA methylase
MAIPWRKTILERTWFITGNLEALKFVGLRPSRKIKLFNASIEARLVKYDVREEAN